MAEEKLRIIIDGDARGATTAFKKTSSEFSSLMKIFGVGMLAGGGVMLARQGFRLLEQGIDTAIDTIKECITEAANAELQLTKLNTALQSTGNFTKEGSDELVKYAESLQQVTAFEDDAIVSVEAMLATFKLSKDEIKIATQAVLDLASATGQDLQSAAILLGKAMVGETGMLKRYGIMVDENKYKAEGWKAVIDEINVEFGGQALAQGNTYTGMLERMKNNVSDLKETIGNAFLPVLKEMSGIFSENFPEIKTTVETLATKIREFLGTLMRADWQPTIDGLKNIGAALASLISGGQSFEMTDQKAQGFANTIARLSNTIAGFLTGMDLTIQAFKILYEIIDLFTVGPGEAFMRSFENFQLSLKGNKDAILENNAEFMNMQDEVVDLSNKITNFIETGNNFNKQLKNNTVNLKDTGAAAKAASDKIKTLKESIDSLYSKTITITVKQITESGYTNLGNIAAHSGGLSKQSGGVIKNTGFSSDLNIPLVKGEAVLPASVVKAIQQNKGSFGGLNVGNDGGSVSNYFNIGELVVREESDVTAIAEKLYDLQQSSLRGAGIR